MPVVQRNTERAAGGNQELVEFPVGVCSAGSTSGHIVQPIDPLDLKGNMPILLHKGKIPPLVGNDGQVNDFAIGKVH